MDLKIHNSLTYSYNAHFVFSQKQLIFDYNIIMKPQTLITQRNMAKWGSSPLRTITLFMCMFYIHCSSTNKCSEI